MRMRGMGAGGGIGSRSRGSGGDSGSGRARAAGTSAGSSLRALGWLATASVALALHALALHAVAPLVTVPLAAASEGAATSGRAGGGQDSDEAELVREEWKIFRMLDADVGTAWLRTVRRPRPRPRAEGRGEASDESSDDGSAEEVDGSGASRPPQIFETRATVRIAMNRGGTSISVRTSLEMQESEAGILERLRYTTSLSAEETIAEGVVEGDRMRIRQTVYGRTTERTVAWPPDVLGDVGVRDRLHRAIERQAREGTPVRIEYRTVQPDLGIRPIRIVSTVVGPTTRVVLGEPRSLVEVRHECEAYPGLELMSLHDESGTRVLDRIPIGGGIETILVPRERAVTLDAGAPPTVDALTGFAAAANATPEDPLAVESMVLEIEVLAGSADTLAEGLGGPRVRILERRDDSVRLRVDALVPEPGRTARLPIDAERIRVEGLEPYLAANSWLQSDDEAMRAAAGRVVAGETDAWKAAKRLERFVYEKIRSKDLSVGFASALEVLDRPVGDCTEHAVLLAALLRSSGIPSRVCLGLFPYRGTFAGHAWVEAWVGEWVALDATVARPFVDASHVALARSSLSDVGFEELFSSLALSLGNLRVTLLHYRANGRSIPVVADDAGAGGDPAAEVGDGR